MNEKQLSFFAREASRRAISPLETRRSTNDERNAGMFLFDKTDERAGIQLEAKNSAVAESGPILEDGESVLVVNLHREDTP